MSAQLAGIGIDINDLGAMLPFWQAVTGYDAKRGDDWAFLSGADEGATGIFLQVVPEPRVGKNRLHIDLTADDVPAEVDRISALGATVVKVFDRWTVLSDPEGNQFCVCGTG